MGKKFGQVVLMCVLWIPIAVSGIDNVLEQLGFGHGTRWDSLNASLFGWGMWLVGCFLWYMIIGYIGARFFGEGDKSKKASLPRG